MPEQEQRCETQALLRLRTSGVGRIGAKSNRNGAGDCAGYAQRMHKARRRISWHRAAYDGATTP